MDEMLKQLICSVVVDATKGELNIYSCSNDFVKKRVFKAIKDISANLSMEEFSLKQKGDRELYVSIKIDEISRMAEKGRINYSFNLRIIKGDRVDGIITNTQTGSETKYNRNI